MASGGFVDAAAAHVLSNNEILMSSPSNAKLSAFYPTPSESSNTIAQAVCNSGQLFVNANSKIFNSRSDFQVSTANILDAPMLTLSIVVPALDAGTSPGRANTYCGTWQDGWGFDIIESLEVSYSNSNISNLIVQGQALRDWSLLQCKNEQERQDLLSLAGKFQISSRDVDNTFRATIPISFLNWAGSGGTHAGFPLDARTLNGSIQFQFKFRALGAVLGPLVSVYDPTTVLGDAGTPSVVTQQRNGVTTGFPTGFDSLELTFRTYQLMDSAFSVAHALQANPGMIYSLPSKWVNSYTYQVDLNGKEGSLQLNSAPAGMIQAILLNFRPISKVGNLAAPVGLNYNYETNSTKAVPSYNPARYFSLPLDELRLQYSGQSIFDAHSRDQLESFYKFIFCDDLKTDIPGIPQTLNLSRGATIGANSPAIVGVNWRAPLHMIPLMHNGNAVFRYRHFENLPHYSGSTLSLKFKVGDPQFTPAPYNGSNAISGTDLIASTTRVIEDDITAKTRTIAGAALNNPSLYSTVQEVERVEVTVTYVVASLLQSTNGVVELQL